MKFLSLDETQNLIDLYDALYKQYPTYIMMSDKAVNDMRDRRRSIKERLFTLPWQPFKTMEQVPHPYAKVNNETKKIYLSPTTCEFFLMMTKNSSKGNC